MSDELVCRPRYYKVRKLRHLCTLSSAMKGLRFRWETNDVHRREGFPLA